MQIWMYVSNKNALSVLNNRYRYDKCKMHVNIINVINVKDKKIKKKGP